MFRCPPGYVPLEVVPFVARLSNLVRATTPTETRMHAPFSKTSRKSCSQARPFVGLFRFSSKRGDNVPRKIGLKERMLCPRCCVCLPQGSFALFHCCGGFFVVLTLCLCLGCRIINSDHVKIGKRHSTTNTVQSSVSHVAALR